MTPIVVALSIMSVIAGTCGYVFGLGIAFAKDEKADPKPHPFLWRLTRKSNPLLNMLYTFAGWAIMLYGLPKLLFLLFGITDDSAFVFSFGACLVFGYAGMLLGERVWPHVA